jgi:aspartate racemase
MKRIGLLGGMSWESSAEYYRFVNEAVRNRLGGLHSADCLLRSVDFAGVEELQRTGRWNEAGKLLAAEAQALVAGGAELLVLCTNTMHRVADQIAAAVEIPLVHIADTTADAVRTAGLSTVGLLATCGCRLCRCPHATCAYSWISPPSRSRRRTLRVVRTTGGSAGPSGGACPKARCGRWPL